MFGGEYELTWVALALIRVYQLTLSKLLPTSCRFIPTCSEYGAEAIRRFGLWRGGGLTLRRLMRCHPFTAPGLDPVPSKEGQTR